MAFAVGTSSRSSSSRFTPSSGVHAYKGKPEFRDKRSQHLRVVAPAWISGLTSTATRETRGAVSFRISRTSPLALGC